MVLVRAGFGGGDEEAEAGVGALVLVLVGQEGRHCQVGNGGEVRGFRTVHLVLEVVVATAVGEVGIDGEGGPPWRCTHLSTTLRKIALPCFRFVGER